MEQYFVSYTVVHTSGNGPRYKRYHVLRFNELAEVLAHIVPHKRRGIGKRELKRCLEEYDEAGRVSLGRPGDWWVIKDIEIRELPEQDRNILSKYLRPGQFV